MSIESGFLSSISAPDFVKARSPKRLRELYLQKQTEMGAFLRPISIEWHPSEKVWYAWFVTNFDFDKEINEVAE